MNQVRYSLLQTSSHLSLPEPPKSPAKKLSSEKLPVAPPSKQVKKVEGQELKPVVASGDEGGAEDDEGESELESDEDEEGVASQKYSPRPHYQTPLIQQ